VTPQFLTLFRWHVLRYLRRHKLLAGLNIISVALGVAVYLAIQIANQSANASFAASVDLVAGKSHIEVRGPLDETLWPKISADPDVAASTAVVEGVVTLPDLPGEYLRVIGIDIFTSAPFRTFEIGDSGERLDMDQWLSRAGSLAVTNTFAKRHSLRVGDQLSLLVNARRVPASIVALIDDSDSLAGADSRLAAMDIGWAQELLGRQGFLSSVQVQVKAPREAESVAERIRKLVPPSVTVGAPRQRSYQMQTMLSAFQLNLTAMSMVSLLVGTFLVDNTVYTSVTRRRTELGILRSLGATRAEVRWLFLGEACALGIVGIVIGCFGGIALGRLLTGAVEQTVSSLYVLVSIERLTLHPLQFVTAIIFGMAAVFAGAWIPARQAALLAPVAALDLGMHSGQSTSRLPHWGRLALICGVLALIACIVALRTGPPPVAFAGAFFVLLGFAVCAPQGTLSFASFFRKFVGLMPVARMAADHLIRSVHRNAVTVAALSTALAMTVGLMVMIHSFRKSVDSWIEHGIVADLFIAPASNEVAGFGAIVQPEAITWLRGQPGVASVDTFRELSVPIRVDGKDAQALLAVVEGRYRGNLDFAGGREDEKMAEVFGGKAIAVSESFARKFHVADGGLLTILTPAGEAAFRIAGVYADYTRDQGVVFMAEPLILQHWAPTGAHSLAVYLQPGTDVTGIADAFRARFSPAGEYTVYSNRTIRQRIFRIFDQTFAVTYVLRTIALVVAIVGTFLSVTALVAERQREIGLLRAVGASKGQIVRLFMSEAGMIGCVATLLGAVSGAALALVLTWVVNPAFFGWTIHLHVPWLSLAAMPFWMVASTTLAAWLPARRAADSAIAGAIREE
jgi:putative ABC transport system permease protein